MPIDMYHTVHDPSETVDISLEEASVRMDKGILPDHENHITSFLTVSPHPHHQVRHDTNFLLGGIFGFINKFGFFGSSNKHVNGKRMFTLQFKDPLSTSNIGWGNGSPAMGKSMEETAGITDAHGHFWWDGAKGPTTKAEKEDWLKEKYQTNGFLNWIMNKINSTIDDGINKLGENIFGAQNPDGTRPKNPRSVEQIENNNFFPPTEEQDIEDPGPKVLTEKLKQKFFRRNDTSAGADIGMFSKENDASYMLPPSHDHQGEDETPMNFFQTKFRSPQILRSEQIAPGSTQHPIQNWGGEFSGNDMHAFDNSSQFGPPSLKQVDRSFNAIDS